MGAGAGGGAAVGVADEAAALGQQTAAQEAPGVLDERGVEMTEHGRAADGGGHPAGLTGLAVDARVGADRFHQGQDAAAVIVAFDHQPGGVVLASQVGDEAGQFEAADVSGKLGALQRGFEFDDLDGGVVAVGASAGGIDSDQVLFFPLAPGVGLEVGR